MHGKRIQPIHSIALIANLLSIKLLVASSYSLTKRLIISNRTAKIKTALVPKRKKPLLPKIWANTEFKNSKTPPRKNQKLKKLLPLFKAKKVSQKWI